MIHLGIFLHVTKGKENKAGTYPIKAVLKVNGKRIQFSLSLRAKPEDWCAAIGRVHNDAPDAEHTNLLLERFQARYKTMLLHLEKNKYGISAEDAKAFLLEREKPVPTLEALFAMFLQRYKDLHEVGKIAEGTVKQYAGKVELWRKYFAHKQVRYLAEVRSDMQEDMYIFLINSDLEHNTAVMTIQNLKTFFAQCVEWEYAARVPFGRLKYQIERKELVWLDKDELTLLREAELPNTRLEEARDCFLFACSTGLSYSDLARLTKENRVVSKGRVFLRIKRHKTKVDGYIPLLEEAKQIWERYDYKLPVPEYRMYLYYLKDLFKEASVSVEKAKTHMGRKTFGNRMLNEENVSLEVVSNMLCHANITTTQRYYAQVSIDKVLQQTAHIK